MPLQRGAPNEAVIEVEVASDGAWHLTVEPTAVDATRGHMRLVGSSRVVLAAAMLASTSSGAPADLSGRDPVLLSQASGSVSVPVVLQQAVSPGDQPGSYAIQIVFEAIAGF